MNRDIHPALKILIETPASCITEKLVFTAVQNCLCDRFAISERSEVDFYRLAVISIKARDMRNIGLPEEIIEKRILQYDCHQTNLVAKMKSLFTLYVERQLELHLEDTAVAGYTDIRAFSWAIYEQLKERKVNA